MPDVHPAGEGTKKRPKIITEVEEINTYTPIIKVVGIGGAGGNAINRMIDMNLQGVEFIAINTDAQDLKKSHARIRLQIGHHLTKGLGAGGNPEAGERAAREDLERIRGALDGAHMIFLTVGLGGGTGSGAAPVIAHQMRQSSPETLIVGVVTLPFGFEGPIRRRNAWNALEQLKQAVDAYIVIPNDNLIQVARGHLPMREAFAMADDILYQAVSSLTDMIVHPGYINVDFADVYNVLKDRGRAVFGVGSADGEGRALKAVQQAINCPILDNTSIESATDVLLNITGRELTVQEITEACDYIYSMVNPDKAQIIFGYTEREDMEGFHITVIAAGFEERLDVEKSDFELHAEEPIPRESTTAPESGYGPATPTPNTLERVFEGQSTGRDRFDPAALRSPAIQRRRKYRFPRIQQDEED